MSDEIKQYVGQYLERELKVLVHEKVQAEEDLRFRQLKWIAIFIGLLGLGSIGTVTKNIIESSVDSKIGKASEIIDQKMEFFNFFVLSLSIGGDDEVALKENLSAIMRYLVNLKDKKNSLINTEEFKMALNQVIVYLNDKKKSESVDRIFKLYESEIVVSGPLVESLIRHYGLEILSNKVIDETGLRYSNFYRLERAADEASVQWRALAYRALYESKKSAEKKSEIVEDIIRRSVYLSDGNRTHFFRVILANSRADNWASSIGPSEINVQEVALSFLKTYQSTINEVYGIKQLQGWDDAVMQGVDMDGAYDLAEKIAKLKNIKSDDVQ